MDPLDMMNSDCWKEVIDLLNGMDKHSVSATCRTFEDLLQAKRSEWMFDAILPCISDWLDVPVRQQFSFRGYTRRNPTWRNLLNCRLVSKSWCYSVDYFMANWYKEEDECKFGYSVVFPQLPKIYCFSQDDGQRFMERFPNSSRNPFFGRSVCLESPNPNPNFPNAWEEGEDQNENQEEMQMVHPAAAPPFLYNVVNGPLLDLYGKHIWKAELTSYVYERLRENFYQNFQRLLSRLPNLRTLKIMIREPILELTEDNYIAQAELVNQFPLPELPCLERIQYYGHDWNYKSVQLLLAKYCGALKHLEWNAKTPDLTHFAQMKCLKSLQLYKIPEADRVIEVLRALQCPLEYLSLSLFTLYNRRKEQEEENWYMDRFLESIQHLPVQYLKLNLKKHNILCFKNEAHPLPTTYPENTTIQTLLISSYDNIRASFNFLPQLKSLESFTFRHVRLQFRFPVSPIAIMDVPNVPKVLDLEYCSSKENVHLMKIWEKVPSLKMFTYTKGRSWSRWQSGDVDLVVSRDEYDQLVIENTEPE